MGSCNNNILRKLLKHNQLVEDEVNGNWYYPPYSMNSWFVITDEDSINFTDGFVITNDNTICSYGISPPIKQTNYKLIDRKIKQLVKDFNKILLILKERKSQQKLKEMNRDFI